MSPTGGEGNSNLTPHLILQARPGGGGHPQVQG